MQVPSAALPGTHNLILFGVRVLNPLLCEPLTPEEVPTGHSGWPRAVVRYSPHGGGAVKDHR
jgi:hypothetical protein